MTLIEPVREDADTDLPVRIDRDGSGQFSWRLTAANGRAIARAADTFSTSAAARAALQGLVLIAKDERLNSSIGHRPGGWGWTVTDERNHPVAHSPRTFERHGSCARSLARFRAALEILAAR